jgi:hypothetical protein
MRRETVLLALVLIASGAYFLLVKLELDVPSLDRLWPVFPFVLGLFMLADHLRGLSPNPSRIFWGAALTLTSVFFLLICLGEQDYTVLSVWWPVFIIIAGISFLTLWLAQQPRDWGVLFLAAAGMLFGGLALGVNLQLLGTEAARQLDNLSPALPILIGLILLLRTIVGQRSPPTQR